MKYIKVFIEQTTEKNLKYIYDKNNGIFLKNKFPLTYPYPYGYIMDTLSNDGDNLDCYIITNKKLKVGSVVSCKSVGIVEWFEDNTSDHKILAVIANESYHINHLVKERIIYFANHFFDSSPEKQYLLGRFRGKAKAEELIKKSKDAFKQNSVPIV
jgi:inorganic pyrophosphatase